MPASPSFLRQLSARQPWKSTSRRWNSTSATDNHHHYSYNNSGNRSNTTEPGCCRHSLSQMEGLNLYGGDGCGGGVGMMRKRVMVVVDQSSHSKHAMMWALTHVTNKGDLLTLLHVIPNNNGGDDGDSGSSSSFSPSLANSLGSLCKACKPEVEVEALVIQGPQLGTVLSQVKKLEVSLLVLGQKKPSSFLLNCFCGIQCTEEEFVEDCIKNAECLTVGVKKQSKGMGGYLISTRWQKNFWLLA